MPQQRLDIDFGPLLALIEQQAAAAGLKRSEVVRQLVQDGLAARGDLKTLIRQAVLDLAAAVEPDERYDPADDPREAAAVAQLAMLLGNHPAAEAISEALMMLWTRWYLRQEENHADDL